MINPMDNQLRELQVGYKGKLYKLSVRIRSNTKNLVVFLHGWGGSKDSFAEAFSSGPLKEYGICTIDLLGFGESEKSEDFSYDLLEQATIVAATVSSLNAKKVYLVGHSMGGGIGLLAAPILGEKLGVFVSAEGNLAPSGSGIVGRTAAKQPFWLFRFFTLPLLKVLLRLHPRHSVRVWAQWFDAASPLGLHRSVQSLVRWSDSGELLPRFKSLPHKAYIYSEHGQRRNDVVLELSKSDTYEIPASDHVLMGDNPDDFYATVAKIIRAAE